MSDALAAEEAVEENEEAVIKEYEGEAKGFSQAYMDGKCGGGRARNMIKKKWKRRKWMGSRVRSGA